MSHRFSMTAIAMAMGAHGVASAQGIATDQQIASITITAERQRVAAEVPGTVASVTAENLREQNLINPEDALRYLPNVTLRKRYIGDRNALIGGRSFSTLQAPRGLVFADGYLLSNFLGRFDAPRWNMISPEEIARVDMLYGPFSAIYPGNSIGTTVLVTTRRPESFELGVRSSGFAERYEEYGLEDNYAGYQISGYLGDRFENGSWLTLAVNRQDSTGHPMQYHTESVARARQPSTNDPPTTVTGVRFDRDPRGALRAVFGANSGAIDHTIQNQLKLRGGYAFSDWIELEGMLCAWDNDTELTNRTFMRDAAGNEVWSGPVVVDGLAFEVPATALTPSTRDELHVQWGTTLRTTRDTGWNGSIVYSSYAIREDVTRQAHTPDPVAASGGKGTLSLRDGTAWETFELQGTYSPVAEDWGHGRHALVLGFHQNAYELRNPTWDADDWRGEVSTLSQDVFGQTRLKALYAQDRWRFANHWSATFGVRYEDWQAFDGGQFVASLAPRLYPGRSEHALSPKLAVSYVPDDVWLFRLSAGHGVRFPTVVELFQGTVTPTSIQENDPNLRPERSNALDFTIERMLTRGQVRVSLFQDDVRDSIWGQTNITVTPNRTNVQNVDQVRTHGIETAFTLAELGAPGLRLEGSAAFARAKILRNVKFPVSVGKYWPRVPEVRASLQGIWQATPSWLTSLGVRYGGRMYNTLENNDVNPDTYGGASRHLVADARVTWSSPRGLEAAFGIDNLTDERYYQSHPFPGRTALAELRWSSR